MKWDLVGEWRNVDNNKKKYYVWCFQVLQERSIGGDGMIVGKCYLIDHFSIENVPSILADQNTLLIEI